MRSTSPRASPGLAASSSRSTTRPTLAVSTAKPSCRRELRTASPWDRGSPPSAGRGRWPSPDHHTRVVEVALEAEPGQALERLRVASPRAGDDVVRKLRAGWGLVPAQRLAVVTDELLVERRLWPARDVLVRGPEAGGVRRERLVGEDESAVGVDAELELRVGDDDAALQRMCGGELVQGERGRLDLTEPLIAHEPGRGREVDVLVVTLLRLRGGREDRLGKPVRFPQPGRELVAAHDARPRVVLPARAGQVAAHDALDREHLEPLALHRAAVGADAE